MQPQNTMPDHGIDREGAMAKADLFKLANYSLKLFKQLQDEDQLESWVQAKITKAADYIASVYHYLEYEMKFNDYGHQLDNAELVNEDQKTELKNKLLEAKAKISELKKAQAGKIKEAMVIGAGKEEPCPHCGGAGHVVSPGKVVPAHLQAKVEKHKKLRNFVQTKMDANNNGIPDEDEGKEVDEEFTDKSKTGDTFKTRTGVATKTDTGMKHTNTSYHDDGEAEEKSGKGIKSHAKSQSAAEKKEKAPAQKMSPKSAKTWGMKDNEKFDNRDKEVDETYGQGVYEAKGKKPDFLDMDKDGDKKEPMKKAVADKKKNPFAKKTNEALKGNQKNLDVDDDGDIEADDLADLRAGKKEKSVVKEDARRVAMLTNLVAAYEAEYKTATGSNKTNLARTIMIFRQQLEAETEAERRAQDAQQRQVQEALKGKQKKLDVDNDDDIEADDLADLRAGKTAKKVDEAKPSAGMSKTEKSSLAKKASAGKDIGKPGKSFDKVAKAAGGGEKGKKIAAAAMWKNAAKESVEPQEEMIAESADLARMRVLMTRLNG